MGLPRRPAFSRTPRNDNWIVLYHNNFIQVMYYLFKDYKFYRNFKLIKNLII